MMNLIMPPGFVTAANEAEWGARLGAVFGRDLADQEPIAMAQLKAMSRYDATSSLAALAGVPTLVLSGTHDLIARAPLGRALAKAIPGARYVEYPDAAHALPIQCGDAVNELIDQHPGASPVKNAHEGTKTQQRNRDRIETDEDHDKVE